MLARQLITTNLRSSAYGTSRLRFFNTSAVSLSISEEDKPERAERKLKEWRKPPPLEDSAIKMFIPSTPKGQQFKVLRRPLRLRPVDIKQWWNKQATNYTKYSQRFMQQRHETLGCDLAAAVFVVHRGGRVKFLGKENWIERAEDKTYKLPTLYDPYWQLTHIDASNLELYYEGIGNFINLGQVKWASFRGNPRFDDWCLDRLIAQMPKIEHLDISECKMLTERGIGALYRLYNLKNLIVTNWNKLPSFELTCIMLQDLNLDLTITIREPEKEPPKLKIQ